MEGFELTQLIDSIHMRNRIANISQDMLASYLRPHTYEKSHSKHILDHISDLELPDIRWLPSKSRLNLIPNPCSKFSDSK